MNRRNLFIATAAIIAAAPQLLFAHPGHGSAEHSMLRGALHPLTGWDHLLAMLSLGMWATQWNGRLRFALPVATTVSIGLGAFLAKTGISLPQVEAGILASVIILGLMLLFAFRLPAKFALPMAMLFGVFHGYAHMAELPVNVSASSYLIGFLLTSSGLMAAGFLGGDTAIRLSQTKWIRAFSVTVLAICGVAMLA